MRNANSLIQHMRNKTIERKTESATPGAFRAARSAVPRVIALVSSALALAFTPAVNASIAWGSINNFDTVNDTGGICHGFEIEIDGVHSKDISYTYDWNHYGVPKITEDSSDPLHPKVFVRYESAKNPDGSWAAFTSVPSAPITPTDGHQFTNPGVNFGGEHFGVGFFGAPSAVKYSWLKDDGSGHLVFAGAVSISTPTFTYVPPAPAVPAQVIPAIVPPPPPAPPVLQFGPAMWVKDTKTTGHNNNKVELRDLVSDDTNDPNDRNWKNGEPDEVETEWRILQTEFAKPENPKAKLQGAPEDLPGGDEVITRRYDFYKYVGPIDAETGEAMADAVAADGIHGVGSVTYADHFDPSTGEWVTITVDLSTVEVVGKYIGAQMAGFDPGAQIGLIDHLQDGEKNKPYIERTIVIGGTPPIVTTKTGPLPDGMIFDELTGVLSGTPTVGGTFNFEVHSVDAKGGDVTKSYALTILEGVVQPAHITVTTSSAPADGGSTSGAGEYPVGNSVTVVAAANPGFAFVSWTDGGTVVSQSATYQFTGEINRGLVANFVRTYTISTSAFPPNGGNTSAGGTFNSGDTVTVVAAPNAGYTFASWTEGGTVVGSLPSYTFQASADRSLVANFQRITYTIATTASPVAGGTVSGGGIANSGDSVTVIATPNSGYNFVNWTEGGAIVGSSPAYTFAATADRTLVANFQRITYTIATSASPIAGGTVSGDGIVNSGDSVTVIATPNSGYNFVNWTEGGAIVSSSPNYTFAATADRTLVANFAQASPTVSISHLLVLSPVIGGFTTLGGVSLAEPAPRGGVKVSLSTSNPDVVALPKSTFVPGGQKVGIFLVCTSRVKTLTTVQVTAQLGDSQKTFTVKVLPSNR